MVLSPVVNGALEYIGKRKEHSRYVHVDSEQGRVNS